jgi:multiple sugar transport system ATP-binding protein
MSSSSFTIFALSNIFLFDFLSMQLLCVKRKVRCRMAKVTLKGVGKIYSGNVTAVSDFNLEIKDKELVVLVGPSGCGKSTTLRMIAGLEEISAGTIQIDDTLVNDVAPKDRDVAMVFQNYALYPHMTVYDNMGFGLKLRKIKRDVIDERVKDAARILDIEDLLDRRPKELSGGQRQRVAVGRAIVRKPKVFLFDEPLSNLDAKLRVQMRVEISKLHQQLEATIVYVTHDQMEAMTMGDRIVVMKDGLIQQIATPLDLYDNPSNRFVASFIGTPPMNFFEGTIKKDGKLIFAEGTFSVEIPNEFNDALTPYIGKDVTFGIRPEDIGSESAAREDNAPTIKSKVDVREMMGSEIFLHMNTGKHTFISRAPAHSGYKIGDEAELSVSMKKTHFFDKKTTKIII